MTLDLTTTELLFGATDEDSAVLVDDYPYGRRVRTQIRYWIETTKHGDRFCSQTRNPKTGRWNKPKKSTYTGIAVMYRAPETGHIRRIGINFNDTAEQIARFVEIVGRDRLSDAQRAKLAEIVGYTRAMERVTWSIRTNVTAEEAAALDAEQKVQNARLSRLIAVETAEAAREIA